MADAETLRPDPRVGLGGPSVGGVQREDETSREFTARMRKEKRAREEAKAEAAAEHARWLTEWNAYAARMASRGSRGVASVEESRENVHMYAWLRGG